MFEFVTHALLFAFISLMFWIPGLVGYNRRSFILTVSIGFLAGGIISFFRDKELISPSKVDGRKIRGFWELLPIFTTIAVGIFVLWMLAGFVH